MAWSIIFYFCRLFVIFLFSFCFSVHLYYLLIYHCYLLPVYQCILLNQSLFIKLFSYSSKNIFSPHYNFYLLLLLMLLCFFSVFFVFFCFTSEKNCLTFPIDFTYCDIVLAFDCFVFSFSRVTLCDHPQGVEACVIFSYEIIQLWC